MITNIEVDDAQLNAVLDGLMRHLGDLTPPLQDIGNDMVARIALAGSFSAHADATSVTIGTNWMAGNIPGVDPRVRGGDACTRSVLASW